MPAPRISLEQWRAFAAVVESGSYAKAADRLSKSQSSITYAVQQIEYLLGVDVFRLEGRKAVLTPTGQHLYRRARYLLEEATALEQGAQRLSAGWEAELRIAVETIFPSWLLLACLRELGDESPQTRIEVIESVLGHRTDALTDGLADLAIFGQAPPGFTGEPLMRVRFLLVTSPDHPLQRLRREATLRDLRRHRHLVVRESSPERGHRTTVDVTQRWTVSHLSMSIEAARRGDGFAWLPEEKIRDDLAAGTLKRVRMQEGDERFADLYLVFRDRESAGPAALRLAEILRARVRDACAGAGKGSPSGKAGSAATSTAR